MHRLLARQIKKHLRIEGELPKGLEPFLAAVDQAYQQFDDDRLLMERAMELSSSELTEKNEKLKELVALGETAKLAMRKALEEAESASRHKSEFLANMSHEIRTPLNAIIGMSNLLIELEQTDQQREFTEAILTSGETLLGVINDVLDFSKIESGELELDLHTFDLHALLESVVDVFGFQCSQKKIELTLFIAPEVPLLAEGDATRIRQVLINLIGNAIKFTREGRVGLSVKRASSSEALRLEFSVEDTGIGIPQDRIDHMFDSFTQVDASITRQFGGTGLGLAICRSLVQLMGGSIDVESEVGLGSTFRFMIELGLPEIDIEDERTWSGSIGVEVGLIVENEHRRLAIEKQLRAWELSISRATLDSLSAKSCPEFLVVDACLAAAVVELDLPSKLLVIEPIARDVPAWKSGTAGCEVLRGPIKPSDLRRSMKRLYGWERKSNGVDHLEEPDRPLAESCPMKILIAEDNVTNQKLLRLILGREGYESVFIANNGREALDRLSIESFDLVFMDLQMPELDGLAATRKLRESVAYSSPPYVLALTANVSIQDLGSCLKAGMHDYLTKPIRRKELKRAMRVAYDWIVDAKCEGR